MEWYNQFLTQQQIDFLESRPACKTIFNKFLVDLEINIKNAINSFATRYAQDKAVKKEKVVLEQVKEYLRREITEKLPIMANALWNYESFGCLIGPSDIYWREWGWSSERVQNDYQDRVFETLMKSCDPTFTYNLLDVTLGISIKTTKPALADLKSFDFIKTNMTLGCQRVQICNNSIARHLINCVSEFSAVQIDGYNRKFEIDEGFDKIFKHYLSLDELEECLEEGKALCLGWYEEHHKEQKDPSCPTG